MEHWDRLCPGGYRFVYDDALFPPGTDSFLLSAFPRLKPGLRVCDLGSGSGIIAILLAGKKKMRVTAVEIQSRMAEMARRSVALNRLEDKIEVVCEAMQRFPVRERTGAYTIVVCNPPYRKAGSGEMQKKDSIAVSRHEITVTFAEVAETASKLLRQGGAFYTVNRCERLAEVMTICRSYRLEPKILQILSPAPDKLPHLFMLKSVFDGKPGLKVLSQRVVRTEV